MANIKTIGLLTSGGDAPGMNAAIRAVTRSAIYNGFKVKGIYRGYRGLVENEIIDLKTQNVSNIIQHGGTILRPPDARNSRPSRAVSKPMRTSKSMASMRWWLSAATVH